MARRRAASLRQPGAPPAARRLGRAQGRRLAGRHFREPHAVAARGEACGIPERSLKRRFKTATGSTLINYVQNLRIEEAKRLLETDEQGRGRDRSAVGYENPAFFRRLFKRSTGLTPGAYRRMFRPMNDTPQAF